MREANTFALAVLALTILGPSLAPAVSAHAAPNPLANEVHVIEDEAEDAFYWYDGYDLYNLFAREAYLETADATGVVFRFTLYGGFGPASTSDEMGIDISSTSAEGATTLSVATPDDHNWTGDMQIVAANVTEDDPPWTGVTARMQVFASYEQLGVAPGGSLEDVSIVSRADDDPRDRAPGGVYLPHSQGQAEAPTESQRLVDSLELDGPDGYIDVTAIPGNGTVTIAVENVLENGQHVRARLNATAGWNASVADPSGTSLPGGEATRFTVNATPTPDARDPLTVEVVTDVGGRETVHVGADGANLTTDLQPNAVDVDPAQPTPNESPGLPAALAVAALAGIAWAHRRRT